MECTICNFTSQTLRDATHPLPRSQMWSILGRGGVPIPVSDTTSLLPLASRLHTLGQCGGGVLDWLLPLGLLLAHPSVSHQALASLPVPCPCPQCHSLDQAPTIPSPLFIPQPPSPCLWPHPLLYSSHCCQDSFS